MANDSADSARDQYGTLCTTPFMASSQTLAAGFWTVKVGSCGESWPRTGKSMGGRQQSVPSVMPSPALGSGCAPKQHRALRASWMPSHATYKYPDAVPRLAVLPRLEPLPLPPRAGRRAEEELEKRLGLIASAFGGVPRAGGATSPVGLPRARTETLARPKARHEEKIAARMPDTAGAKPLLKRTRTTNRIPAPIVSKRAEDDGESAALDRLLGNLLGGGSPKGATSPSRRSKLEGSSPTGASSSLRTSRLEGSRRLSWDDAASKAAVEALGFEKSRDATGQQSLRKSETMYTMVFGSDDEDEEAPASRDKKLNCDASSDASGRGHSQRSRADSDQGSASASRTTPTSHSGPALRRETSQSQSYSYARSGSPSASKSSSAYLEDSDEESDDESSGKE